MKGRKQGRITTSGKKGSGQVAARRTKHAAAKSAGALRKPRDKRRPEVNQEASAAVELASGKTGSPTKSTIGKPGRPSQESRGPIPHEQLLNALPHPVFVFGPDNAFVYANAAGEAFLQTSVAMLKRARLDDIVAFGCPLLALIEQVRRDHATINEYGIEVVTPRLGGPKLVDVYGGSFPDRPDQVVLMLQQRTMAQMIERQLTHRAAARSVSGIASILAHEIKNPLSGIRGAAQLLETSLTDDDRVLSQLICTETDRISSLLDRMEVFGDERPLKKEAVNIHDVLDHVRQLAMAGFARNIQFVADYDPSLPAVPANRDKLVQAFLNLVKNAAEAIGPDTDNGRIVITTAFKPGVRLSVPGSGTRISLPLMIEIQDNGPGVPGSMIDHMFDPFVTSKANGTGLGLALVAKLIADHGGTIECESEPNKTIFKILLPLQEVPKDRESFKTIERTKTE